MLKQGEQSYIKRKEESETKAALLFVFLVTTNQKLIFQSTLATNDEAIVPNNIWKWKISLTKKINRDII